MHFNAFDIFIYDFMTLYNEQFNLGLNIFSKKAQS